MLSSLKYRCKVLTITFVTKPLKKRPTQAFFKSCVKQASKDDIFLKDLHNLDGIETADGLEAFAYNLLQKKRTVTNFSFMYIEEY